eukprot:UN17015
MHQKLIEYTKVPFMYTSFLTLRACPWSHRILCFLLCCQTCLHMNMPPED